ncbi:MAG TPA: HAMP domain-containing sensor histidine kinase [Saprospiraceae bacterium]|nr:HAMP domain-containing sensor histidine kinase [Saprospiraceae bacterium]
MNKKAIWLIIGLMTAALVGSSWLQVNWISSSIRLNEDQFDKNVYEALNAVAGRLEYEEQREAFNYMNGYSTNYYEREARRTLKDDTYVVTFDISYQNYKAPDEEISLPGEVAECNCSKCINERLIKYSKLMRFNQEVNQIPLAERIFNLDLLEAFLKKELASRGINIEYNYGVFSNREKSFVIANDHYVVEDNSPQVVQPGYKNLFTSKYRVDLFRQDMPSPGLLMIYFPNKSDVVWGSVWENLLASILFTAVILFCFTYTVQVIFKQKKLSEMKNDFINNMTHEFKTPIATISLAADSITNPLIFGNPDKVKRFADIIKQENKRMNTQVEKVLQMAVLDRQDFQLKFTQVNLHEVIQRAVENFALQVEKKDGILKTDLQAVRPDIQADLTHVTNIVHNLMDNANKYSPEKPEIMLSTRNVANGVELVVEDKGIGMNREALKHIFDKFYRVHTGDLHDVKGFGLGLSYVKAMMLAHRGQIDVKSEPGKGSRFILFFPFKAD